MTNPDEKLDFKSLYLRRNHLDNALLYLMRARVQGNGIGREELEIAQNNIQEAIRQIGDEIWKLANAEGTS